MFHEGDRHNLQNCNLSKYHFEIVQIYLISEVPDILLQS